MVMLSQLLRQTLADVGGQRAKLVDLAVDLSTGDYPPVTRLIYRGSEKVQLTLPWEAVQTIDWRGGCFQVADLGAGQEAPPEVLQRAVLLDRDVMDALVLDLANCHAIRANDLWLREED